METYLDKSDDISSCYCYVGKTDKRSIFFISDVIPITQKYIKCECLVGQKSDQNQYIIKNKALIKELERKVVELYHMKRDTLVFMVNLNSGKGY